MAGYSLGIRSKLIIIFILIKVVPLAALAWFSWEEIANLSATVEKQVTRMLGDTQKVVGGVTELSTENSIQALDSKSREAIERLTTDTARQVAEFLYDRDRDISLASTLPVSTEYYRRFLNSRFRGVTLHTPWKMNATGDGWIPAEWDKAETTVQIVAKNKDNSKDFHYRPPDSGAIRINRPLYMEMTFVDLSGNELIKVGSSDELSPARKNIAQKINTYCNAESYFPHLQKLKPGEIYVSEVIGEYIKGHMIGTYSETRALENGIAFNPEDSGYAGKENPVGKRFQGIVRWATPVLKNNTITGYVTLALDHTHIMEFTDHIIPTKERYSAISDAGSGNYAFMWDYKGRNISHPRDYFIHGYDPATGEQAVPWLDTELYELWNDNGKSVSSFESVAPQFKEQSLEKKPAPPLTKAGMLGLDCRYLNFAPQCSGWFNLTHDGGSGSFVIFWSGLWKLTTAAAIPYYTGIYGESPRGFGFVTIGANVNEFHSSALQTAEKIQEIEASFTQRLDEEKQSQIEFIRQTLDTTFRNLTFYTLLMIAGVIVIAFIMAGLLTSRIMTIVKGFRLFQQGDRSHRLEIAASDEMGQMASAYNEMAETIEKHISDIETSKVELEGVNEILEREVTERRKAQDELAEHHANLEKAVNQRTEELKREVTERKRIEETQNEIEKRLREQNGASLDLAGNQQIYKGDLDLSLDFIVPLAARTLKVSRCGIWLLDEARTTSSCRKLVFDGEIVEPDQHDFTAEYNPQLFKGLRQNKTIFTRHVNEDKNMIEIAGKYLPDRNIKSLMLASISEHGEFAGWVSFAQLNRDREWHLDEVNFAASVADITGLAISAARQRQATVEKEELTTRLRRAEKMEALGTLAGGVAHDLNNILSGIVSYPELLLLKLPKDSQLREPVNTILSSGKRAAAIVQDLLTMARRGVSNVEVINLNRIIEDYLASPEHNDLKQHHEDIRLETKLEPGLLNILGSSAHLSKTLMNLVSNAFEAIPLSGLVTITSESCYIDRPIKGYDVVKEGDYVALTVEDTGVGIAPEDFNRIFEPFYTKKKMGRSGTGLGMAVVWGTVKDHQGYIDFDSGDKAGSRFTLYFPVTRKQSEEAIPKQVKDYQGRGESILVVDDVEEQREIASAILTTLGYEVHSVESGETAVQFLSEKNADLVILDMIMDPGMDGLDTYQQITRLQPDQRVIIASGFSETERTNEVLRQGASLYVKKPYTIEKIGTAVWTVLNS